MFYMLIGIIARAGVYGILEIRVFFEAMQFRKSFNSKNSYSGDWRNSKVGIIIF